MWVWGWLASKGLAEKARKSLANFIVRDLPRYGVRALVGLHPNPAPPCAARVFFWPLPRRHDPAPDDGAALRAALTGRVSMPARCRPARLRRVPAALSGRRRGCGCGVQRLWGQPGWVAQACTPMVQWPIRRSRCTTVTA